MGLREELQADLAEAFDEDLADAVDTFTCIKEIKSGRFDYATQTYQTTTNEAYSGRGVLFGSYLKDMVKPLDYQITDCKATVLQNEVSAVPVISDVWTTAKGNFKVVNIGQDPTGSIWVCQLRKV
ncbi:glutamate 5-kinase [Acinetobacter sp. ANC 4558]|uniref:glutamate 5-kinase n=1 Tax=Acinetobacter sp. ANC 4558 TaxID=1977876 RepID=UPI000A339CE9|nr:glutamate 5-kinase [Acinetobacter sp. ANC 4558]OTG79064.1 glutamate 5-kinase [Acinetobacter sp. ANC 4558]